MKKLITILLLLVFSNITAQTTTWNGFLWSAGIPNPTTTAIINGPYDTSNDGIIACNNLVVNPGASMIIEIGDYCSVYGNIDILPTGTLLVKSGGSLVPSNDFCVSTGVVSVERKTPSMKRYDYTYWSSPVVTNIGNALLPTKWEEGRIFTFNTPTFYDVETTYLGTFISNTPDGQDDNGDAWINSALEDNMVPGKGYACMVKSMPSTGIYPRTETVTFTGLLNTGIKTIPLHLSQNTLINDDDFNLVGNPYPASINSNDFIDDNISNISGTLYFWTHSNTLSTAFSGLAMYNFSPNDYAKYTKLGGIRAVFGGRLPSNVVGSGQGFIIEAENAGDLLFKPNMMSIAYSNTTPVSFFRGKNNNKAKIWLDMNNDDFFSEQLIGYNNETNLEYNKGWDSKIKNIRVPLKFYSVENSLYYDIQSRGRFNDNDNVNLGYYSAVDGQFTITINDKEGKLKNHKVYLVDHSLNNYHDLSEPYVFTTTSGKFDSRFSLRYKLPEDENEDDDDDRQVSITNNHLNVSIVSDLGIITNVKVFDLSGRLLKETNEDFVEANFSDLPKGILIFKITVKGRIITRKVIL